MWKRIKRRIWWKFNRFFRELVAYDSYNGVLENIFYISYYLKTPLNDVNNLTPIERKLFIEWHNNEIEKINEIRKNIK